MEIANVYSGIALSSQSMADCSNTPLNKSSSPGRSMFNALFTSVSFIQPQVIMKAKQNFIFSHHTMPRFKRI